MVREPIAFLSPVLVVSTNPQRLATFYRDVIGIPLREEQHGGSRDVQALARRLEGSGVPLLYPPRDTGFFVSTAVEDPDGNFVEFTERGGEWFTGIDARRAAGDDVVARWRVMRAAR